MKTEISIENKLTYQVERIDGETFLNGRKKEFEFRKLGTNRYLMLANNKVHNVDVTSLNNDVYQLKIDGQEIKAELFSFQKKILKELGLDSSMEDNINELVSPMPGAIIEIICKSGDEVAKGDPLLILEAMKMENVIKSPTSGTIQNINVDVGQSVEKNQSLIVF